MKEEYYNELNEIFLNDDELAKKHEKLFKNRTLIVESIKKQQEVADINKELQELNK